MCLPFQGVGGGTGEEVACRHDLDGEGVDEGEEARVEVTETLVDPDMGCIGDNVDRPEGQDASQKADQLLFKGSNNGWTHLLQRRHVLYQVHI